jgi:hypothetical protein
MRGVGLTSVGILVSGLACGGSPSHHLADGAPDSPKLDAPTPDAPASGTVSVVVTLGGSASANVPVYFQNADSTLVVKTMTDATGTASATMRSGGFVTLLEPQALGAVVLPPTLDTYAGVKAGDVLHDDVPTASGSVGVTFSLNSDPNPLAASYVVHTTCGDALQAFGSGTLSTSAELTDCNGIADVVVVSETSGNVPLDSFAVTGVTIAAGSNIGLKGSYAAIPLQQVTLTDVPPELSSSIEVIELLGTPHGAYFDFPTFTSTGSASLPQPLTGATDLVELVYTFFPATNSSVADDQQIFDWGPSPPGSVSVDVGARKLHDYVTRPQLNPTDEQLQWAVGSGAGADYLISEVSASRNGSAGASKWSWKIVSPGVEEGAQAYPTLPTDIFDFNFRDTDALTLNQCNGFTSAGGYDAARPHVFAGFNQFLLSAPSGSFQIEEGF